MNDRPRLLANLPPTFFTRPEFAPFWERLRARAELRQTSHDLPKALAPDLAWADGVIMWAWPDYTPAMLAASPRLKYCGHINASRRQAEAALERGLALSEARHGWSEAVAELALALALAGLRRLGAYHHAMRGGRERWVCAMPGDVDARERKLGGKRVGLVGFGRIGQRLAELLAPFRVDLRVYDPYVPESVLAAAGARGADLPALAADSDVLVLCAANTAEAEGLLSRELVFRLQEGAVVVNVGRSMLVDMPALAERAARGEIVAMLDVFDEEPLPAESPWRSYPDAWLTPHRGGGLIESLTGILGMLADDWEACLDGLPPRCPMTREQLHCLA